MTKNISLSFQSKTIKGSGKRVTEERSIGQFERLSIAGPFAVELEPGSRGAAIFEIDDNLVPHLSTEIERGRLEVELRPDKGGEKGLAFQVDKLIRVKLPIGTLSALDTQGECEVRTAGPLRSDKFALETQGSGQIALALETQRLAVELQGSGSVKLSGHSDHAEMELTGSSTLDALGLTAQTAKVEVTGAGKAGVNVDRRVDVQITGAGTVAVRGSGEVHKQVTGKGRVVRG